MLGWSGLWAADSARSPLRDLPLRDFPLPLHRFLPSPLHAPLRSTRFSARSAYAPLTCSGFSCTASTALHTRTLQRTTAMNYVKFLPGRSRQAHWMTVYGWPSWSDRTANATRFQRWTQCGAGTTPAMMFYQPASMQTPRRHTARFSVWSSLHCSLLLLPSPPSPPLLLFQTTAKTTASRHPVLSVHRQPDGTVEALYQPTEDRKSAYDDQATLLSFLSNTNSSGNII